MIFSKAVYLLLINLILLQCHHLAQAYTQIAASGSSINGEGPKIFKAINFDLIYPKSFNSSENVISTTPETIPSSSSLSWGADVNVDQQYNPLPQSNEQTNKVAADSLQQQQQQQQVEPQPLYVTPPSNEAASYDNNSRQQNTQDSNINAQVVTPNRINIQQQQQEQQQRLQQNDNNNAAKEPQPQQQQDLATGRAVDYRTAYPFGQLITPLIKSAPPPPRPVYNKPAAYTSSLSNVGKTVYPQAGVYQQKLPSQAETDKLRGRGPFKDRFAPSQGVAAYQFKSNNHHHNHAPSYTAAAGKTPSASNVVNSYVPPANLYSFPPNNVNYPSQPQSNKVALPSGIINSYAPPPSGSLKNSNHNLATASTNDNPYQYPGPIVTTYGAPPNSDTGGGSNDGKDADAGGGDDSDVDNDNSVGVLPASAMDGNNSDKPPDDNDDTSDNADMGGPMDSPDDMSHDHDHHHDDHSYDTGKEYPTPPPGWLEQHPEHDHHDHHPDSANTDLDHDHHHHHPDIEFDHDPHSHHFNYHDSYPSFPIYHHSYPEHIYDDHHDHHDHHVEHVEPPPSTTEPPPPEPPPEPRVKKYSYFYIGRKLWYIPLYFTVWFSFYVLWLIVKSIARHKVNLPNHYVSRRSVDNYDLSKQQKENINQLTVAVMNKIENFKRKYMN